MKKQENQQVVCPPLEGGPKSMISRRGETVKEYPAPEFVNSQSSLTNSIPALKGWGHGAFTLAEVLITLGIIGVVAAMTMPTLITKYQEKALETQIAKAKTTLANGYKLMMARNDDLKIENLPMFTECGDMDCISKHHKDAFSIVADSLTMDVDTLPQEYAIWASTEKSPFKWADVAYVFMTGDGMVYGVIPDETFQTFDVVADVNGSKNPNVAAKDLRKFRLSGEGATVYDVSEELTQQNTVCSVETPEGCLDSEACYSLPEGNCDGNGCYRGQWDADDDDWENGKCVYRYVIHVD